MISDLKMLTVAALMADNYFPSHKKDLTFDSIVDTKRKDIKRN